MNCLVRGGITTISLLIEEDFNRQPRITTDLEAGLDVAQLSHLVFR